MFKSMLKITGIIALGLIAAFAASYITLKLSTMEPKANVERFNIPQGL